MRNITIIMVNELYFSLIVEKSIILADGTFKSSPCCYKKCMFSNFYRQENTYIHLCAIIRQKKMTTNKHLNE